MCFMRMRHAAAHLDTKLFQHPFNQQLQLATLPKPVFRFFLDQDALYLADFAKVLVLISQRTSSASHARQLQLFSQDAHNAKHNLHAKYLGETYSPSFFYSKNPPIEKIAAVSDYSCHLFKAAQYFPLEAAIASLIPCFWIYSELGKRMSQDSVKDNPYQAWITSYADPKNHLASEAIIQIMEEVAKDACSTKQAFMNAAFLKSAEYELALWDQVMNAFDLTHGGLYSKFCIPNRDFIHDHNQYSRL